MDQPDGISIRIYRCRLCGTLRSCRPRWLIRCHVCLDERSRGLLIATAAQRFRGTIAKLHRGSVDCAACGPGEGSRTHLARGDDPYLLYLVAHRRWQKFGVGDHRRVRAHQRGGAEVMQVLQAPFADVVLAESTLKRLHREQITGRARRGMISSFGHGTEVARRTALISLTDVLPHGEDVTHWFR